MMVISDIRPKGEWSHLYFILSSSFDNIFFCISFSEKKERNAPDEHAKIHFNGNVRQAIKWTWKMNRKLNANKGKFENKVQLFNEPKKEKKTRRKHCKQTVNNCRKRSSFDLNRFIKKSTSICNPVLTSTFPK